MSILYVSGLSISGSTRRCLPRNQIVISGFVLHRVPPLSSTIFACPFHHRQLVRVKALYALFAEQEACGRQHFLHIIFHTSYQVLFRAAPVSLPTMPSAVSTGNLDIYPLPVASSVSYRSGNSDSEHMGRCAE